MKSKTTALILSVLVGGFGVDRFYLGYMGMGILKLLTGGCLGILWIIDIISIATGRLTPADGSAYAEDASSPINSTATQNYGNNYDNLEKLAELHKQGVLNDDEYTKMKSDILSKIS